MSIEREIKLTATDPKLKEVGLKVQALMDEHDLVGTFVFGDGTGLVNGFKINASWSSAHFEEEIGALQKITFRTLDLAKSQRTRMAVQTMRDMLIRIAQALNEMVGEINQHEQVLRDPLARRPN